MLVAYFNANEINTDHSNLGFVCLVKQKISSRPLYAPSLLPTSALLLKQVYLIL